MTRIAVDIDALTDMAARLRALRLEFEGMGDTVHGYEDAVGHHEVAQRLGDFAGNWSEKRKKIATLIEEVAGYADAAAQNYAELERQISSAATGGGG